MATVYAAACFAIKHKILPLSRRDMLESLLACTRAHIAMVEKEQRFNPPLTGWPRGDEPAISQEVLLGELRKYVRANQGCIVDSSVDGLADQLKGDPAKWPIIRSPHKQRGVELLFSEATLLSIFEGNAAKVQRVKTPLKSTGDIAFEKGSDGPRFSIKRRVPGGRRIQITAIKATALEGE